MSCVYHSTHIILFTENRTVDAAAVEPDPLRRIAFVAAFAMSNYSSTIGRIAKPFNPMLVFNFDCFCACLCAYNTFFRARRLSM
jgi:hypothetical protein